MQDVGDEMHYLLICPCFQNDREKYIKKYFYTRPNILKVRQLMSIDVICFESIFVFLFEPCYKK